MKKLLRIISLRAITPAVGVCMLIGAAYNECHAAYSPYDCSSRLYWCTNGGSRGHCGELSFYTRDDGDKTATQECERLISTGIKQADACQAGVEILENKTLCSIEGQYIESVTCTALLQTCISFINEGGTQSPCDLTANKEHCLTTLGEAKKKHPLGSNAYQFICNDFFDAMKNKNMCKLP